MLVISLFHLFFCSVSLLQNGSGPYTITCNLTIVYAFVSVTKCFFMGDVCCAKWKHYRVKHTTDKGANGVQLFALLNVFWILSVTIIYQCCWKPSNHQMNISKKWPMVATKCHQMHSVCCKVFGSLAISRNPSSWNCANSRRSSAWIRTICCLKSVRPFFQVLNYFFSNFLIFSCFFLNFRRYWRQCFHRTIGKIECTDQ